MGSGNQKLDRAAAYRYATAWAKKVHADLAGLTTTKDGDFYGDLGSIAFDYINRDQMLITRAYVMPFASSLTKRPDVQQEFSRIEKDDPKSVGNARFDLLIGRWQTSQEPSLYLRRDFADDSVSVDQFVTTMKDLGDIAYLWDRTLLNDTVRRLNRLRKE